MAEHNIDDIFAEFGLGQDWMQDGLELKPADLESELGIDDPQTGCKEPVLSGYLDATQFQSLLVDGDWPQFYPLQQTQGEIVQNEKSKQHNSEGARKYRKTQSQGETVQTEKRKQQNRDAARKYRTKKRQNGEDLKTTVAELQELNENLKLGKKRLTAEVEHLRVILNHHMQTCNINLGSSNS